MARVAFWKGYLKLSLVTCAVTLTPGTTESEKVRFHTLSRKSGRRVRSRYVDAETGAVVKDEAKGYESADGTFVTFEDEELEAVALESVRTIDVDTFVASDAVPWIWYDSPYYVAPSDTVGEEAFSVIREAMRHKGVVGISRLVMNRRERAVLLKPRDRGIVLWTLRYGDEVRDPKAYFRDIDAGKPDGKLLGLVEDLIEKRSKPWDPDMVRDPVQERLQEIIAAKRKRGTRKAGASGTQDEPASAGGSNVIDLMAALKKSLEAKPGGKGNAKRKS